MQRIALLIGFSLLLIISTSLLFIGKLALLIHKAVPAEKPEHHSVTQLIQQLSKQTPLDCPELHIIQQPGYNAFSTRYGTNNAIAITQDLINLLDNQQLNAVLAHEIAHINLHQSFLQRAHLLGIQAIRLLLNQCHRLILCCLKGKSHPIRHLVAHKLNPLLNQLTHYARFQAKEFQADAYGAKLCGSPEHLAAALKKIEIANHQKGFHVTHTWQSSHPPVSERIRRLEAIRFGAYI